jgi:hypothetical protein
MSASLRSLRAQVLLRYPRPAWLAKGWIETLGADGRPACVEVVSLTEAELLHLLPPDVTNRLNRRTA